MGSTDPKPQPPFYQRYLDLVPVGDLNELLQQNRGSFSLFLESIPSEKWDYRYAPEKWSIKEMIQHIIDAERIFTYRALCFARGERAQLPGFDENTYAAASDADSRTAQSLIAEFNAVRTSTVFLFKSFTTAQLNQIGTANNNSIDVFTLGRLAIGHALHHKQILTERYLN